MHLDTLQVHKQVSDYFVTWEQLPSFHNTSSTIHVISIQTTRINAKYWNIYVLLTFYDE
jgi:hypothetical protein